MAIKDLGLEIKIKDIKDKIERANNIGLFTHVNVDCDGVGTMCALYEYLQENGKSVRMFCDSDIPEKYSFLNGYDNINKYEVTNFDLIISLDTASSSRLGKYESFFLKNINTINIDHHISNNGYGNIDYIQPYSSCGEVLYEILKEFPYKISSGVATSLYGAISSDTNRFSNPNISALTYLYSSELLDLGADANKANYWLHKLKSLKQLRLAGYMASNLIYKDGVSYILITQKIINKLDVKINDVSNFLNLITNVENSKITFVIKEQGDNVFRLNMRSTGEYDVNKIAKTFGGGGHKNAAGTTIKGKYKNAIKKVLEECYKEVEKNKKF